MHIFEVWAPRARTVAVSIGGKAHPMQSSLHGWWKAEVSATGPGTDYGFIIDGGAPLPDPRSAYQPHGVDALSRLVDHAAFHWTDRNWQARPLSSSLVYELHIGTFTPQGTFRSTLDRLDYLADLGVTHVELMPINEFSGDWGWGYDGVDLYAPHHVYGTPDDLKTLIDASHAKGLAVLLDVVYNHLGPSGNYLDRFGPYFTHAYKTPWGPAVNLDHHGSDEVRRFLTGNAVMWLRDYHFDGLRLDAIHAFHDRSAIPFLEELALEVETLSAQLGRHLVLIAESDLNDPRIVTCREAGGFGLDAQWSDDFHHALHAVLTGETNGYYHDFGSLAKLATALRQAFVHTGTYSAFRGRNHGKPATGLSGHRFLAYSQNHDQIGNRAHGERLCHLLSPGRQKIAAALVLTSPFVPMLFQGEEFCASAPFQYFTQHEDIELARNVSAGRRSEFSAFGWNPEDLPDPQAHATFERAKLSWDELQSEPHASLLAWYKKLITLRRSLSSLTDGRLDRVNVAFDGRANWLVMKRGDAEVVCNFAADSQAIPISGNNKEIFCSESAWRLRPGLIELPSDSVAILTPALPRQDHPAACRRRCDP
ncbi:MAG TPA: malto-oligosyltrehalose trehalohydrolase [Bryobacteraceae bacterium]